MQFVLTYKEEETIFNLPFNEDKIVLFDIHQFIGRCQGVVDAIGVQVKFALILFGMPLTKIRGHYI